MLFYRRKNKTTNLKKGAGMTPAGVKQRTCIFSFRLLYKLRKRDVSPSPLFLKG